MHIAAAESYHFSPLKPVILRTTKDEEESPLVQEFGEIVLVVLIKIYEHALGERASTI